MIKVFRKVLVVATLVMALPVLANIQQDNYNANMKKCKDAGNIWDGGFTSAFGDPATFDVNNGFSCKKKPAMAAPGTTQQGRGTNNLAQ